MNTEVTVTILPSTAPKAFLFAMKTDFPVSKVLCNQRGVAASACLLKPTPLDDHKDLLFASYILLGVSFAIQVVNIMAIDYDLIERVINITEDADKQGLVVSKTPNVTANVGKILFMLGMPMEILQKAFPGKFDDPSTRRGALPLNYHAHWAHPGIFRLLSFDPIFGLLLSVQDFLGFKQVTGVLRILCNICMYLVNMACFSLGCTNLGTQGVSWPCFCQLKYCSQCTG